MSSPFATACAARRPDLLDDLLGGRGVAARAVGSAAEVVDYDLGALGREQQRVLAAEAAAGPGDDGNPVVKRTHRAVPSSWFRAQLTDKSGCRSGR